MTDFEDDWALLRPRREAPQWDPAREAVPQRIGPLDPYALVALDRDRGIPVGPYHLLLEDEEGLLLGLQVPLRLEDGQLVGSLPIERAMEVHTGVVLFAGRPGIRVRFFNGKRLLPGDTLHISMPLSL